MPQLQLLTSKETQLKALQFVREAASLRYKTPQGENDRTGKIFEAIIRTERGSVPFTHAEDTKTTSSPNINSSTYFQQSSQAEHNIKQYKGYKT